MMHFLKSGALAAVVIFTVALEVRAQDIQAGARAYNLGDYVTAVKLWRPLAEKGDRQAQHHMGLMYAQGLGVPRDHAKSTQWFRKAAQAGHVLAAYNLGFRYLKGEGVPQDFKTAASWFRRAAGAGLSQAQHTLGLLFTTGEGVPQDYVRAYMWLSLSAKQKNRIALKDRDAVARQMTAKQIQQAEALVGKWRRD